MAEAETGSLTTSTPKLPFEVTAVTAILALVLALLAGVGAALYQRAKPTHYVSATVLLIDQPTVVAAAPDDGPLLKLQALRYYYAAVLRTSLIAGPVAQQLNLPIGQVENDLTFAIDPASFTMDIVATTKSPTTSEREAQAATQELISYVAKQQQSLGFAPTSQVVLDEVTPAVAGVKLATSTKKQLVSAAVAFVVVGAAFLIVADLRRRRW